ERTEEDGLPVATSRRDPAFRSCHLVLQWPAPLDALLGDAGGIDDMFCHLQMLVLALESAGAPDRALRAARGLAAPYVTLGSSRLELSWFWPTLLADGAQGVLFAAAARYGLEATSLDEALRSKRWQELASQEVPIRRA